jgi:hypothetical protein
MGRKPSENPKIVKIAYRLTPDVVDRMHEAIKRRGGSQLEISESEWARAFLKEFLDSDEKQAAPKEQDQQPKPRRGKP